MMIVGMRGMLLRLLVICMTNRLIEICEKIDEYFPGSEKVLKVSHDPCDGSKELIIFVKAPYTVKECMGRLDRFDAEWWYKQPEGDQGTLTVMVG